MKVAVGLRRVAAGKRTSGRRAAQIARKEESRFKGFNLFNKKEIEKATKHINDKMDGKR